MSGMSRSPGGGSEPPEDPRPPADDDATVVRRVEEETVPLGPVDPVPLEPVGEETVRIRRTEEVAPTVPLDPVDPTVPLRPVDETGVPYPAAEGRRVEEVVERRPVYGEPRRREIWPYLLALLLLVLGGLAALYYFTQENEKPVPAVVRLPVDEAVDRLTNEGFRPDVVQQANAADAGIVFEQRPDAGVDAEEGSRVTVLVSRGPATVPVPNAVGLSREEALSRLDAAGLGARQVEVFSERAPGTVVAQDPGGGERAARGSKVRLNVSRGTGRVNVPNVVGQSSDDAGANIRKTGLQARVVEVPSGEPEGTVVAQNPPAGSELGRGAFVRINVSTGTGAGGAPATTSGTDTAATATESAVPDVAGLDEATATGALEDAGFRVRAQPESTTDAAEDGLVIRQMPAAGDDAPSGSSVTIVVGELSQ